MSFATEHAQNSALEVRKAESIKEGINERVDGNENKVKISQPVNEFAAASMAKIHEIDHDTRGDVAGDKDPQHDQIGLGELVFHLNGSLAGFVMLGLAIGQGIDGSDLVFGVLENTHVREDEDENGTEHGDVGKHKCVCHKTDKKEHRCETTRYDPHHGSRKAYSLVTRISSVPERLSNCEVAING